MFGDSTCDTRCYRTMRRAVNVCNGRDVMSDAHTQIDKRDITVSLTISSWLVIHHVHIKLCAATMCQRTVRFRCICNKVDADADDDSESEQPPAKTTTKKGGKLTKQALKKQEESSSTMTIKDIMQRDISWLRRMHTLRDGAAHSCSNATVLHN